MNELKSEIIIKAGIRTAEQNFSNAYITKRGDSDAGAIFVKIDTLDGYAKLYSRNLVYDFDKNKDLIRFEDLYPTTLSALEFTQEETDVTYIKATSEFTYKYYEIITL